MILKLYVIKDELSEYATPLPFENDMVAKRYFRSKFANDPMLAENKNDFSIWETGEYDTTEGQIRGYKSPKLLERGKDIGND